MDRCLGLAHQHFRTAPEGRGGHLLVLFVVFCTEFAEKHWVKAPVDFWHSPLSRHYPTQYTGLQRPRECPTSWKDAGHDHARSIGVDKSGFEQGRF
jgi:hypothetical protein